MAEYYAVERSPEYLMHYGIKGMRWGVRKAIERGNSKALSRQYKKATKKLLKLNNQADIGKQKAEQIKYAKRAGIGLGVSALGVGGILTAKDLKARNRSAFNNFIEKEMHKRGLPRSTVDVENFVASNPMASSAHTGYYNRNKALRDAQGILGAIDLAGLGYAGYAGARSLMAKHRTTSKGHAKAITKRDEFQREMNKAFAGTQYAKKPRHKNKRK